MKYNHRSCIGGGIARISGLLIFSLLLILLSSCRQTILLPLPDPDAGNGEIASGIKIDVEGMEITATINEEGKAVLDLSSAVSEKEEIATIKDANGDTIYDVNDSSIKKEGFEYNPDNKTLTIDNIDNLSGGLTITAEKVKVLLYDAKLTIDGRNYECSDLKDVNLKGKYSKPSEAWNAVKDNASSFTKGIYILLNSDIEEDSLSFTTSNENTTIDLNKHSWSKATPSSDNKNRIISPTITPGHTVNVINGTLRDNTLNIAKHYLGAAIYANNTSSESISEWPTNKNKWGIMNIFNVDFSNNYAEGGGAICISGAIELNVYDSQFDTNKSLPDKKSSDKTTTGSGSAIFVWQPTYNGEIVNLYDCTFTGNNGDGMLSVQSGNSEILFNIYGGAFTGNRLYVAPLMSIYSFNIYGGNFSGESLSNDIGNSNPISINGGIIDTLDINGSTNTLTLKGGSVDTLKVDSSTSSTLVSATLPNAAKVEYVEYTANGGTKQQVNINSPFNIDSNGDVIYKYESRYSASNEVFNGSDFNPAITQFSVFLPADALSSIDSITVYCADNTYTLSKDETGENIKFVPET